MIVKTLYKVTNVLIQIANDWRARQYSYPKSVGTWAVEFRAKVLDQWENSDSTWLLLNFYMEWTIDIYGNNHQVESLKWTLNHMINRFYGFNK